MELENAFSNCLMKKKKKNSRSSFLDDGVLEHFNKHEICSRDVVINVIFINGPEINNSQQN